MRQKAPGDCQIAIAGNKCDLIEEVAINKTQGKKFAENQGVDVFFETSAKENIGLKELFEQLSIQIHSNRREARESYILKRKDFNSNLSRGS